MQHERADGERTRPPIESAAIGEGAADGAAGGLLVGLDLRRRMGATLVFIVLTFAFVLALVCMAQAAPDGTPPAAASLRAGEHDGFTRLVVDWPARVAYRLSRGADGSVRVAFDRSGGVDLGRWRSGTLKHIRGLAVQVGEGGHPALVMQVAADARIKESRLGSKIIFDVYGPGTAVDAVAPSQPPPAKASRRTATSPAAPPVAQPKSAEPAVREVAAKATAAAASTDPPVASSPPPAVPPVPVIPATAGPGGPPPPVVGAGRGAPASTAVADATERSVGAPDASAGPTSKGDPVLRFRWREPTAAAVFVRGDAVWVVFDRAAPQDLAAIRAGAGDWLRDVRQLAHRRATVLRLTPAAGVTASVRREGTAWLIELTRQTVHAAAPIEPDVQTEGPAGPRLWLSATEPGEPIPVVDPEAGDVIVVVPVPALGQGLKHAHDFPDFNLLATVQGFAVQPRTDELRVQSLRPGVEITAAGGLQLSPVAADARLLGRLRETVVPTALLDADGWWHPGDPSFAARRQSLQRTIAAAGGDKTPDARMALAQLLIGAGLAAEALGELDALEVRRPESVDDARFRLMRGMARLLMHRLDEAAQDLRHPSLDGADEAALWRGVVATLSGDAVAAAADIRRAGDIAARYPDALRLPAMMAAAEALIAGRDTTPARRIVEYLSARDLGPDRQGQVVFLDGLLLAAEGDSGGAVARWRQSEQGLDRLGRLRSTLARIDLQLASAAISPRQARDELDAIRLTWRGDPFELALLARLGRMEVAAGEPAKGLRVLRDAAALFPDHPATAAIGDEMRQTFERLYLDGGADALPPMSAIALFDEFRELTPAGEKGDAMILRLADRLVAVDLLDRAAGLLEEQVKERAQGEARSRLGARLAVVYLLDRRPAPALAALDATAGEPAAPTLAAHRRRLQARALIELGRGDEALQLIADDIGGDGDLLRAELFWRRGDWRRAGMVLQRVAEGAGARAGQPLDERQARWVLNQAVALTLDGDGRGLDSLRRNHAAAMAATPFGDAFRLVAGIDGAPAAGLRQLPRTSVEAAAGFQSFLQAYRDRVRREGLAAVN